MIFLDSNISITYILMIVNGLHWYCTFRKMNIKCDYCDKTFKNNYYGKNQLKKHTHNCKAILHRNIPCHSCGKTFSTSTVLKAHILEIHERHKNFKCASCGILFSRCQNLNSHIYAVHEDQKEQTCDSCDKMFSKVQNLKAHFLTIHHAANNHKCNKCGKFFSREENLKMHIHFVHENQRADCDENLVRQDQKTKHFCDGRCIINCIASWEFEFCFWMTRNQKVIEKFIFPSNLFSGKCAKRLRYYNFYNIPIEINKPSRKSNPQHTIHVHRGGRGKFPLSHNPSPPQQFWTSLIREFSHFDDISPLSSPITWKNFLPRPNPPSAENFWFPALFPLA